MSRITHTLSALESAGRKALIPFITAGDPDMAVTVPLMHTLVEAGADIIELGVPFSDPMADGPTIQRASERALLKKVSLRQVIAAVAEFRTRDSKTPVVLMGYANPIEAMGVDAFASAASTAGADGVLVVDYPPEESKEFAQVVRAAGLDVIFLLAPTSTDTRIRAVGEIGSGYIYYVSLKGVTGAGHIDIGAVSQRIPFIRESVGLPVAVGFGVRDGTSARALAGVADAVVIGSRIIEEIEQSKPEEILPRVGALLGSIRTAMDTVEVTA
ncbi:MAG: tryptophan synthase subunit alpha [Methyloversatilis sp.]|jgi:tryptophan synthase alpha chain|nr:tryptophan synthase subunit alpha [Methyloversatilis sp.]MBP6194201.1 tryptophan synthase subunit alpha [Methyloversatilis sp.]MBP9118081.1 tryptophan synthase subunit alpha [Methyloversatilis sp.]